MVTTDKAIKDNHMAGVEDPLQVLKIMTIRAVFMKVCLSAINNSKKITWMSIRSIKVTGEAAIDIAQTRNIIRAIEAVEQLITTMILYFTTIFISDSKIMMMKKSNIDTVTTDHNNMVIFKNKTRRKCKNKVRLLIKVSEIICG